MGTYVLKHEIHWDWIAVTKRRIRSKYSSKCSWVATKLSMHRMCCDACSENSQWKALYNSQWIFEKYNGNQVACSRAAPCSISEQRLAFISEHCSSHRQELLNKWNAANHSRSEQSRCILSCGHTVLIGSEELQYIFHVNEHHTRAIH